MGNHIIYMETCKPEPDRDPALAPLSTIIAAPSPGSGQASKILQSLPRSSLT